MLWRSKRSCDVQRVMLKYGWPVMALDGLLQSLLKHLKASEQSNANTRFFQHFVVLWCCPNFQHKHTFLPVFVQSGGRSGTISSFPAQFVLRSLTKVSRCVCVLAWGLESLLNITLLHIASPPTMLEKQQNLHFFFCFCLWNFRFLLQDGL